MKYFSGSGRRPTARKSMIWMKIRVSPRLASRTVSTRRAGPGTKPGAPIPRSRPPGTRQFRVAATTHTPRSPSAQRASHARTPPWVRVDGTLVGARVGPVARGLGHLGGRRARAGRHPGELPPHRADLGTGVARAETPPLLVLRDLTRDEQEPPAARLGAVGVADGSRERRRVVELDPLHHGLLPSRTIVSPLVAASSSRVETAAATSAGSMSRPPGLIRAMARTASSNDLPVFAAMLRAAVHTRSVPV